MADVEPRAEGSSDIRGFIARIKRGDEQAARELLERYEDRVRLVVRRRLPKLLRSRFDSLDFMQSVWASFFRQVRSGPTDLHEEQNLIAFLAWAARNKVIDEYRRASSQGRDIRREESLWADGGRPLELADAGDSPSDLAEGREAFDRLASLLPEQRRRVLELKAEGFTCREIGARVGLSERTVQRLIEELRDRAGIEG